MENKFIQQYNSNDGYFELQYKDEGVFLTVYPPDSSGKKVEIQKVMDRINYKKIKDYKNELVENAVNSGEGIPVKIAEPQEEVKFDAVVNVTVSNDKMKAYIAILPPDGGKMLNEQELMEFLNKHGIIHGINKSNIYSICNNPVYNEPIAVAEGTSSINGQNGQVQFHFNTNRDSKPTILEDGRVNFRDLGLIENVTKGQLLCSLIPPQKGIQGKTVLNTDLPVIHGKDAVLPKGKNVEVSEDGQKLVSSIDGQVNYVDGKVNVLAVYEVQTNVDNSTGNINFVGNVIVKGNVVSGFVIEAGGSVEVLGVVESAVIKAGGDIILRRGMQGLGKGVLVSGGDIIAKYIENSNIEAKGNIKSEAIMHSNVKCGNNLELAGKKGLLVGGLCRVGKEVIARVIGSYMATVTEVEVGLEPIVKERYKLLKDEIIKIEDDLKKTDQAITILKKLESVGKLTPDKQDVLTKSIRTKIYLSSRMKELSMEIGQIELKLQEEANGKVKVNDTIYMGTKVAIGACKMHIKESLQHCTLYRDGADIRVGPLGN